MKKMKKERYTCITFFFQLIKGHTFFKVYTQKVSKIYTHTIFFQGFSLICKRLLALFIWLGKKTQTQTKKQDKVL